MNDRKKTNRKRHGYVALLVATSAIAAMWLLILPWIAEQPAMERHLNWLNQRGIDPSAMYYTELDAMEPILHRLERERRR